MLLRGVAAWGADFVGLNPIHALYPANPESCSPYSPSSRRWLNVIYIDVEAIPDFYPIQRCKKFAASEIQEQQLNQLRAVDWIDYQAVFLFKMGWLRRVFEGADLSARTERARHLLNILLRW